MNAHSISNTLFKYAWHIYSDTLIYLVVLDKFNMDKKKLEENVESVNSSLTSMMIGLDREQIFVGNMPLGRQTLEDLTRLSEEITRPGLHQIKKVKTGLTRYTWRRVYDADGKIDYDLVPFPSP